MKSSLCCCLAAIIVSALASPNPQAAAVTNANFPTPPASSLLPSPLANAAIWQEAVSFDAKLGSDVRQNQNTYQLLAWFQTQENSSLAVVETNVEAASKGLQYIKLYPTDFNQEQALDPKITQGMSEPGLHLSRTLQIDLDSSDLFDARTDDQVIWCVGRVVAK